jgi:hypothetical protein
MKNIGLTDKIIRFAVAIAIVIMGIVYQSWWGILAIVPLLTATISFCPLYSILGMGTCRIKTEK